jgi:pimeloyl-ACP methyl ester carboxylesterase
MADGATPRWLEAGEARAGAPVLVCLHGVSAATAGWSGLLPLLAPRGWRVLAWDMPGYGASPVIEPYDFPALAAALGRMLNAAGVERAVLLGHSMGGMVALEAAASLAQRVRGLVLACATPAFGAPSGAAQQAFLARRLGPLDAGADMAALAAELIPTMLAAPADAAVADRAAVLMARIPPASYRAAMHALVHFDRRAGLAQLQVPALCLAGTADMVSPPAVVEQMARRLPQSQYLALEGAGHLAPFEQPEAFAQAVRDFLASIEAGMD